MSIIIPSKQIYSIDNKKVKNNVILGTTGTIPDVYMPEKQLLSFNWQPFVVYRPNPMKLIFKLVPSEFPETNEITLSQEKDGSTVYVVIKIKLSDTNFIDIKNLQLSFSYQYIYGRSLDSAESNYRYITYYGEPEIKTININPLTQAFFPIIPSKNNIPVLYIYSEFLSPDTFESPTKEATIQFKIPVEYWTPTTTENDEDVAFLLDIIFFVTARSYNYDNTISFSFGETTKKTFEIPTNELSIAKYNGKEIFKYISEKTIGSYKNGKETATIRASIGEYYEENGDLAISSKKTVIASPNWEKGTNDIIKISSMVEGKTTYTVPSSLDVAWYTYIGHAMLSEGIYRFNMKYLSEGYGRIRLNIYDNQADGSPSLADGSTEVSSEFTLDRPTNVYLHFCSDASNTGSNPSFDFEISLQNIRNKMTFEIGDKVIPMVRRADGTDTPMSRTISGSAKQFRVCGTKIYYDGAVWQELTLQEV